MTQSPDVRGIDVALLYQPMAFRPICYDYLDVKPLEGMRPTRDILYVKGETLKGDTLHIFVVHAPSRFGGEKQSRPNRQLVADRVMGVVRQLPAEAKVIIVGDFNDGAAALVDCIDKVFINDAPFLLEEDKKYGGVKPLRTFNGYRYQRGFSDHLPLVVRFRN